MTTDVRHGDCLVIMQSLADNSIDAVITDPPYDLTTGKKGGTGGGFMGKAWDGTGIAFDPATWRECLRVLKPGGHLLSFGGTRTSHRMAVAIEDAGFEIRDSIAWLYGSGFPKSKNVALSIDKREGHPDRGRAIPTASTHLPSGRFVDDKLTPNPVGEYAPVTDDARKWQGWGTALKPAFEPIIMARKPFQSTVAANVLTHGTGAINVDACRIGHASADDLAVSLGKNPGRSDRVTSDVYGADRPQQRVNVTGRWPANVVLDEGAARELDEQVGTGGRYSAGSGSPRTTPTGNGHTHGWMEGAGDRQTYSDTGGPSRFYYCAKASRAERPVVDGVAHPTVKPLALMRWLVRLVTPPGGTILDPFAGSGTTLEAALLEGFDAIGIESEADYLPLIQIRIDRNTP